MVKSEYDFLTDDDKEALSVILSSNVSFDSKVSSIDAILVNYDELESKELFNTITEIYGGTMIDPIINKSMYNPIDLIVSPVDKIII